MSRNHSVFGRRFPHSRKFALATTAITCIALTTIPGKAAAAELATGDALVTHFSGTVTPPDSTTPTINIDGVVATAIGLNNPGFVADGRQLQAEVKKLQVTAADVGQVFGIAIDDAKPANIYLTASSAFGLHRNASGDDWMDGMWGRDGGPGTIYKLNAQNGYKPEVFAEVNLGERSNTGAALGNIAFDAANQQLLVSDLETGMIHRLAVQDGRDLGTFDHGTQARAGFFDAANGAWQELDPVAFDPATSARPGECDQAGESPSGAQNPTCWNIADFRRRVWGIGVHTDEESGETRVYYGIWGTESLGNPEWEGAGDDARNAVWSIALDETGAFQDGTARREFIAPEFLSDPEKAGENSEGGAIADIAFAGDGRMLIGERGGLKNLGLGEAEAFADPHRSRVLQYVKSDEGLWTAKDRIDVGFDDRSERGAPYIRANAGGGVDFGFGYTAEGGLDTNSVDASIIASGDGLCSTSGPCFDPDTQAQTDIRRVDGVQVSPSEETAEIAPAAATQPYPEDGPATPANAPARSYMIDVNADTSSEPQNRSTQTGDVEVYRQTGVTVTPVSVVVPVPEFDDGPIDDGPYIPPTDIDIPDDDIPPPNWPIHYKWQSQFHQKWASLQHNKATSKPWPVHVKWMSKFHQKWKSHQHNKVTSKPFPIHIKWKSKFHKKWKSHQHNKVTSKPFPLHIKWKSKFHKKWKSVQHNKATSKPFPLHIKWKSKFHKKWKSVQHNKATSKPFPLHIKWKSKFHKKWKSVQHNKVTSKPFPLHIKWKSKFHKKWKSVQHNKVTSKPFPLHIKWKSKFHKKWKSVQHNKVTSKPFPLHIKWKSKFHKKWKSVQHNKATSKPFPLHIKWKSKFHKKWKSVQHNKATSKPFPLHIKWKSKFHKKWKSVQHNKATSKPFPLHIKWKSKFHKKWKSKQHNKATSKPFPLHIKWKSKFHKKWKSKQHNKATSKPFPLHIKWKSKFHKKWKSKQHNKATSKPFTLHIKWKSKFHKKWKSHQHKKATSRPFGVKPVHLKRKSRQHNKATSRPFGKKPVHLKRKSRQHNKATSRPFGKKPVHLKRKSRQHNKATSRPFGKKPVHLKHRSRQHNKATSRPRRLNRQPLNGAVHNRAKSNLRIVRKQRTRGNAQPFVRLRP